MREEPQRWVRVNKMSLKCRNCSLVDPITGGNSPGFFTLSKLTEEMRDFYTDKSFPSNKVGSFTKTLFQFFFTF